jgi:glycosyltransferase involved in cell wall biosynthesis
MQLSVIIPVYNVEKYVARAISSILQNGLDQADYEIVVVDDESPDASLSIVRDLAVSHPQIKIISQKNKGLGGARNTGIRNASGSYVLFLDADDWINPGMLRNIVDHIAKKGLDILEFGAAGVDPDGKTVFTNAMTSHGKDYNGLEYVKRYRYMWSACNKIYNANFLKQNELYFEEHIYSEDFEFFTRVMPKVAKMEAIDLVVAGFYQSADSITRNNDPGKKQKLYTDLITIIDKLKTALHSADSVAQKDFYLEHAGILVTTLFFQFVKNGESFATAMQYRNLLRAKGLFMTSHRISPFSKDIFRRIFVRHFFMLRLLMRFRKQ